jgi:hypothetical protein
MKTTIDLPDELWLATKMKAAERRTSMRALVENALRREVQDSARKRKPIPWGKIAVPGTLPDGADISNREKLWEWIDRDRD